MTVYILTVSSHTVSSQLPYYRYHLRNDTHNMDIFFSDRAVEQMWMTRSSACKSIRVFLRCLCLFAHSNVQHFVLPYVFAFGLPGYDIRYNFRIKDYVRVVFTPSCMQESSCLFLVLFVCLRIVVSNTFLLYVQHCGCLIRSNTCLPFTST